MISPEEKSEIIQETIKHVMREQNKILLRILELFVHKSSASVPPFMTRKEIQEFMGWSPKQFSLRKDILSNFGLVLDGSTYKMPYNGFMAFLDSLSNQQSISAYF